LATYWQPYHQALAAELARLRAQHGHALLWDGHSIRSELPWLFDGQLPALNLGTASGASCAPALRDALMQVLARQSDFSHVTDGRFKGGYITRRYGQPEQGVHAVQMEMCWHTYMDEAPPWRLDPARVARLQPLLRALLQTLLDWRSDV
jgi:N-formylglutamate deformylase